MVEKTFNNIHDFCTEAKRMYGYVTRDDEYASINIIGRFEDMADLTNSLIRSGFDLKFATEFADVEYDNYADEFIVAIYDNELWVEPAKRKDEYIGIEADLVYITSDCNSKILKNINATVVCQVIISDEDIINANESYKTNEYPLSDNEDSDFSWWLCEMEPHDELTANKESYKVNGKEVSKSEYETIRKEIDEEIDEKIKKYKNDLSRTLKMFVDCL